MNHKIWMRRSRSASLVLLGLALFSSRAAARPAKDILHFKNKDKWTCEITKLDSGISMSV
jgi:hypothetical protein